MVHNSLVYIERAALKSNMARYHLQFKLFRKYVYINYAFANNLKVSL